jgi:FKBP-type peptidyl-prolyl cis-trans isomerase FkpA
MQTANMYRCISCAVGLMLVAACQPSVDAGPDQDATELIIRDLHTGDGRVAVEGMTAVVHYTGWLYAPDAIDTRGEKFDSSLDRGQPFSFDLGAGQVIAGWDQGVAGMRIGGRRELIIPPELAYGSRGAGGVIPPDATLVFEIELTDLR